jgi:probable phosphoglycerate mutase
VTCYLVRHGQDDETVRGGWCNSGLNDEGKIQVKNLVDCIIKNNDKLKIEKLFSSDLQRAIETVMPISAALNLEVDFRPEFRETNNGVLAGMPNTIAKEKYPGLFWSSLDWDESYLQGESPRAFYERIKAAWQKFSEAITKTNENVVLVTHGGVINVIYTLIEGTSFSNKMEMEDVVHATLLPLKYGRAWRRK